MSIRDLIRECVARGDLFPMRPSDPAIQAVRSIYVSRTVREFVMDPTIERAGQLQADLDHFISGSLVTVSAVPFRAGTSFLGLLHPPDDGIWDIRSQDPRPALRVFGGFAMKDVFVGLVLRERKQLGDKTSRQFSAAIRECKTEWQRLFLTYRPLYGVSLNDHLSNHYCVD